MDFQTQFESLIELAAAIIGIVAVVTLISGIGESSLLLNHLAELIGLVAISARQVLHLESKRVAKANTIVPIPPTDPPLARAFTADDIIKAYERGYAAAEAHSGSPSNPTPPSDP